MHAGLDRPKPQIEQGLREALRDQRNADLDCDASVDGKEDGSYLTFRTVPGKFLAGSEEAPGVPPGDGLERRGGDPAHPMTKGLPTKAEDAMTRHEAPITESFLVLDWRNRCPPPLLGCPLPEPTPAL